MKIIITFEKNLPNNASKLMIEEMDCGNRISPIKIVRNSKKERQKWQILEPGGRQERKKQSY